MAGDDQVRYCGLCEKNVYNFSAMTSTEVVELIQRHEGQLCARFYRRSDGTMLTTDCPVGVHHRVQRRKRRTGLAAAIASFFLSGCLDNSDSDLRTNRNPPEKAGEVLGAIAPPSAPRDAIVGKICIPDGEREPVSEGPTEPEIGPEPQAVE
jgi:hypothetical protein